MDWLPSTILAVILMSSYLTFWAWILLASKMRSTRMKMITWALAGPIAWLVGLVILGLKVRPFLELFSTLKHIDTKWYKQELDNHNR